MIYMDNAATTRPKSEALKRAEIYLTEKYFNPSGLYREGFELKLALTESGKNILSHVASPADYEIVFTSCGSEADNTAIFGYGRRGNVVTTAGEHSAVINSVKELKNRGVEERIAPLSADGKVDVDKLVELVDEKTSLVSAMHVNNETGAINDINEIARLVKEKNPRAVFHSDGVQAYGKIPYKIGTYVDMYSISAHKIGAVKGVGALIKKKKLHMNPLIFGGGQEGGKRSGTENVFGIKDFEYAAELKFKSLNEDFKRLSAYKEKFIGSLNKDIFSVISPKDSSPYVLCLSAKKCRGEILLHMADDKGLIIGTGSACSSNEKNRYSRVILACGYSKDVADGVIRVSFSDETTENEIINGAKILNAAAKELFEKME